VWRAVFYQGGQQQEEGLFLLFLMALSAVCLLALTRSGVVFVALLCAQGWMDGCAYLRMATTTTSMGYHSDGSSVRCLFTNSFVLSVFHCFVFF
jgi:hypothetical protein